MSITRIKYLLISLGILLSLSHTAQAQWMMSFNGSYDLPMDTLKENFQNQIGINTNLHYKFPKKPFEISLSMSFTPFRAKGELEDLYKMMQQDTLGFEYQIHKYSAPMLIGFKYYPLEKKKAQAYVGLGFGAHYLVDKTKMIGDYTSTTIKEEQWKSMFNAHAGIIYKIQEDLGIQLTIAYQRTLEEKAISYAKLGLGIIYHI